MCAYRGDNGRKCAVGMVIPDEDYSPDMELFVASKGKVYRYLVGEGYDVPFLIRLQHIHDIVPRSKWENEFEKVAEEYSLIYTERV